MIDNGKKDKEIFFIITKEWFFIYFTDIFLYKIKLSIIKKL